MDELDKQLLTILQSDFPITSEPYKQLANQLGISSEEAIARISNLKKLGVVRKIGGIFDTKKLGYASTLCAMRVPTEKIEETAKVINSYVGVTHNYLRESDYNMWFTLIAPSRIDIELVLSEIKKQSGIEDIIELPAKKLFKINVKFSLEAVNI